MLRIVYLLVANSMVYCEWVQISQSPRITSQIQFGHALVQTSERPPNFGYTKYKDFLSVIEPDDFNRDYTISNEKVLVNLDFNEHHNDEFRGFGNSSSSLRNPYNSFRKNEVSNNLSNVSVFSGIGETKNKAVINTVRNNSSANKPHEFQKESNRPDPKLETNRYFKPNFQETNEDQPKKNQMKLVLKRVEYKPFSFDGVLKFFANIQQSFSFDASTGIRGKVKFLEDFKNNILTNIEQRLRLLWPSKIDEPNHQRIRRSPKSHGMDFPSSETALMTVSFLTLAVFLIKLVLQVINTIKSKHIGLQTMTPSSETPIKIIKTNLNARKLSLSPSTSMDDLQAVTKTINTVENGMHSFT